MYPVLASYKMEAARKDDAVFRRLLFATAYIPKEVPGYWNIIARFGSLHKADELYPDSVRRAMEAVEYLHVNAFSTDATLERELINMEYGPKKLPLGIHLVPKQSDCLLCKSKLLLRADRTSSVVLYTQSLGIVLATHYHKYCSKYRSGCKFVQYYGYWKCGATECATYNDDWASHLYFISTQETGFELSMLKDYDVELLIGQISYKQKADIYNITKGYDQVKKTLKDGKGEEAQWVKPVHG